MSSITKVAIVTGAGSGIGRQTSIGLSQGAIPSSWLAVV